MTGLAGAAIVGTSRGGLIAMLMAVLRPCALAAVVLNDIGPVLERDGLARIAAYVGRMPLPADWEEAAPARARDEPSASSPRSRPRIGRMPRAPGSTRRTGCRRPATIPTSPRPFSVMDGPMPELWPQFGGAGACAGAGDPRRELRHPERRDAGGDARAASAAGGLHRSRPGPRARCSGMRRPSPPSPRSSSAPTARRSPRPCPCRRWRDSARYRDRSTGWASTPLRGAEGPPGGRRPCPAWCGVVAPALCGASGQRQGRSEARLDPGVTAERNRSCAPRSDPEPLTPCRIGATSCIDFTPMQKP